MAKQDSSTNTDLAPDRHALHPSLIVGIGASAGGLAAFSEFLANTPSDSGMAFVLLPHLDPTQHSMMPDLLSQQCEMPVRQVEEGQTVEANCVYILQPAHGLTIADRQLHLQPLATPKYRWTVVDQFLCSLATDQRARAVGIILSGSGQHGLLGLIAIKRQGGLVLAQSLISCQFPQMPQGAIDAGMVDRVLDPADMPAVLLHYANHSSLASEHAGNEISPELIDPILEILRASGRFDFRHYRKEMIVRRILRRMTLSHVTTLKDYKLRLQVDLLEVNSLIQDLLIGVTAFFRNPLAFDVLKQQVLPELVARCGDGGAVRVWVPACSTGEEAYTLAILVREAFEAANRVPSVQIIATDIDEEALSVARQGIYSEESLMDVSAQHRKRFFVPLEEGRFQVIQQLRDTLVFGFQSVIGDPPVSHVDLISCRNLLIYLQSEMQSKLIQRFHMALNDSGYLLLGHSESLGPRKALFSIVSKQWRVFRHVPSAPQPPIENPISDTDWHRLEGGGTGGETLIEQLESELKATRKDLQSNLEDTQTANEELRVANEEMMSMNEELQSANEELETSTEKLQSMNEELDSVNTELQRKLVELETSRDDIVNLLASTDIPTLFLDRSMRIKLFNPPMAQLLNLSGGDMDRPIADFGAVQDNEFFADAQEVMQTLSHLERVVSSTTGANPRIYLRRSVPYRATNDRIGGVVITFVDITERAQQERLLEQRVQSRAAALQRGEARLALVLQAAGAAVWEINPQSDRELVLADIHRQMFGALPVLLQQSRDWWLRRIHPEERPGVELSLQQALDGTSNRWEQTYRFRMANGAYHWFSDTGHISRDYRDGWQSISGAMIDINERQVNALEARKRAERMAAIMEHTSHALIVFDQKEQIRECNPVASQMFGYNAKEFIGKSVLQLIPENQREVYRRAFLSDRPFKTLKIAMRQQQLMGRKKNGSSFIVDIRVSTISEFGLFVCTVQDLSEIHGLQKKVGDIAAWEQENIGRELHDGLGQRLTVLHMMASRLRTDLAHSEPAHASLLGDIIGQLKAATSDVRRLSRGLAPIAIAPGGLADALASLVELLHAGPEARYHFQNRTEVDIGDAATAHQLYRIGQEALNNALKYARAANITVSLDAGAQQQIELVIEDDGVGFDMAESGNLDELGLRIMRYRANTIGALLSIDSAPAHGTRISCVWQPRVLPDSAADDDIV